MTSVNDSGGLEQTFCHACGRPLDFERDNTFVESIADQPRLEGQTLFWHQDCFDNFLDQGEET